jgi:hypothetical protein
VCGQLRLRLVDQRLTDTGDEDVVLGKHLAELLGPLGQSRGLGQCDYPTRRICEGEGEPFRGGFGGGRALRSKRGGIRATPAEEMGTVAAADADAAIKVAVEAFSITNPEHQKRLAARKIG